MLTSGVFQVLRCPEGVSCVRVVLENIHLGDTVHGRRELGENLGLLHGLRVVLQNNDLSTRTPVVLSYSSSCLNRDTCPRPLNYYLRPMALGGRNRYPHLLRRILRVHHLLLCIFSSLIQYIRHKHDPPRTAPSVPV